MPEVGKDMGLDLKKMAIPKKLTEAPDVEVDQVDADTRGEVAKLIKLN